MTHRWTRRIAAAGMLLAAAPVYPLGRAPLDLAAPALSVRIDGRWHEWWRADSAPAQWQGPHPLLQRGIRWRRAAPGVELGEVMVSGAGEAWRIRVVFARIDTARVTLHVAAGRRSDGAAAPWTIDSAPAGALAAVNAGQFAAAGPWGWVVRGGVEHQAPGRGPLAPALVRDSAGGVRWVEPDSIAAVRGRGAVHAAFQSYPTLLGRGGTVPPALRAPGLGVDHDHRDARVAIGFTHDGRLLVALTRFAALGEALSRVPFGLTTPEMAALMGAAGAERAMLLDGGASSQLLVRENGTPRRWRGIRAVPVGLVVMPRTR